MDILDRIPPERLCRINREQPTLREKWIAFYRLWRIGQSQKFGDPSGLCFRVLLADWKWIKLVEGLGDRLECNRVMPIAVRWQIARRERERRLNRNAERLLASIFDTRD